MAGDIAFFAKNGLVANTSFTANSTQVNLGANVLVTPSTVTILSTISNVVVNSTAIFIGNSTVNAIINVVTSGGSGTANVNSQYIWTNTHVWLANVTFNGTVNEANAAVTSQTLTDAATISWNGALGKIATVTLAGNRTMAAPTNLYVGTYLLHVIQDGVGSRTITWNAVFKWPQATAPVLSTAINRHDIISFICDGTNLYGSFLPDVR